MEEEEERREGLGLGRPGGCVSEGGGDSKGAEARELGAGSPSSPSGCRGAAALPGSTPAAGSGAPRSRASLAPTQAGWPSQSPTPPPSRRRWKVAPCSQLRLLHSGRGYFRPQRAAQRPTPAVEGTARVTAAFQGTGQLQGGSVVPAWGSVSWRGRGELTDQ